MNAVPSIICTFDKTAHGKTPNIPCPESITVNMAHCTGNNTKEFGLRRIAYI